MGDPITDLINEARAMQGLAPGPPGDVILPTRAVDENGIAISDRAGFRSADGGVYKPLPVVQFEEGVPDTPQAYARMFSQPTPLPEHMRDEPMGAEMPPPIPTPLYRRPEPPVPVERVSQQVPIEGPPPEGVSFDNSFAFWGGHSIHLTADEVTDIKTVLQRAAVRQLDAERERLANAVQPQRRVSKGSSKRRRAVPKS